VRRPTPDTTLRRDTVCAVVASVSDIQAFIGSALPAVLAIGFAVVMLLRRRERRRGDSREQ
jgi:hypothetical protein